MKIKFLIISILSFFSINCLSDKQIENKCNHQFNKNQVLKEGKLAFIESKVHALKKGHFFNDQQTKLCIQRITDHKNEPPKTFARIDYARRQALNADNSLILVYAMDGYWHLYNAKSGQYVKQLKGPTADAELYWDVKKSDIIYYMPPYGGLKIYALNVVKNTSQVVTDFKSRLPWKNAARVWTKSEGSPSADGRYWGFQVETEDYKALGLMVWDKKLDIIVGTWDFAKNKVGRPDHTSMSPSGEYIIASWDGNDLGTTAFSRNFMQQVKLHHKSEHSDLALLANGHDAYVSVDYQSHTGDVFMIEIQTGVRTNLFSTYIKGTVSALHFSGEAYQRPGWILVSSYGADITKPKYWLHEKIFILELKKEPKIYSLVFHHSKYNGYWTEPHATVSRDFSQVFFNSNWNKKSKTDIDIYQVTVPDFELLSQNKKLN